MSRMAGYNLVEDSSGKNISGTKISKRGRKNLRSVLYQMALTMVATNEEMKQLYHYLKTREKAPLRKMQALIVISKRILSVCEDFIKSKDEELKLIEPKEMSMICQKILEGTRM